MIQSKYLNKNQIADIQIIENALEIYWNKKRLNFTLKYLTDKVNMFQLFLELGKKFQEKSFFHRHNIDDIYDVAESFFSQFYINFPELRELLAIDYYHFAKSKPKQRFLYDINREEKKNNFKK